MLVKSNFDRGVAMFDNLFINYCAPTLMGLKVGSIFSYKYDSYKELYSRILYWNSLLNSRGIFVTLLKHKNSKVIVYIYDKQYLRTIITNKNISSFLSTYGYNNTDEQACINLLKKRFIITKSCPHEIGIFLGYPLADVKSFIKHNGKNSLYTGYWKVQQKCPKGHRINLMGCKMFDWVEKKKKIVLLRKSVLISEPFCSVCFLAF